MDTIASLVHDLLHAARLVVQSTWRRSVKAWIYVPVGLFAVMSVCFGVHQLIGLARVGFPASVACMILLFLVLALSEATIGDRRTKKLISLVDIPCGFALRYINLFFCPAFVTLPLSPDITAAEVGKITAIFVLGYAIVFSFTAYFVRALQVVFGTSKKAIAERAEEMGDEADAIPLSQGENNDIGVTTSVVEERHLTSPSSAATAVDIGRPEPSQDPFLVATSGSPLEQPVLVVTRRANPVQQLPTLSRAQIWATWLTGNLDMLAYIALTLSLGVPIYYDVGYAMPLQLGTNVICYLLAMRIPARIKTFLHPVLVSSALTILAVWCFAVLGGRTLHSGLGDYTTGTKYTQLWNIKQEARRPGAGDVFGSILDVSIVALGLPMYQYRSELKSRFATIVIPNITLSIASLMAYPAICRAIGIAGPRGLAFASRSLTLALATPATQNLGGDLFTVAPLCIFSGIIGVVVGPWALKVLKVPEDDYVTRGVTLGANSSAVATALLLTMDPRAAAFSSLSMGLFGTITVALTSIPKVVDLVRGLAGL